VPTREGDRAHPWLCYCCMVTRLDHKQFVKVGDSVSRTTVIRAGTPQGTVSGPNDFKLFINDLSFNTTLAAMPSTLTVDTVIRSILFGIVV